MKTPKRPCKCGCEQALPSGRIDMLFVDDSHRKKWLRAQPLYQVVQAVKRAGLPDEFSEAADYLKDAQDMADTVAEMLREDAEMFMQIVLGLTQGRADQREEYTELLSDLRSSMAGRVRLLDIVREAVQNVEETLLAGQVGEAGHLLLLDVLATVPGLELAEAGDELAGDEDEDEA